MDLATIRAIQTQLPNPLTPMAFFPPDVAMQVTVSLYTVVGALAVMIWDILIHLGADYRLITRYPIRPSTVIYFISRWSSFGYLVALAIFYTAPVGNCWRIRQVNILTPFAISSTSLLFFLRVRALYDSNKWVVGFFVMSWLGVLGGSMTSIFGVNGSNISITQYCINSNVENYVSATALAPLINDTLVFLATTYRLTQNAYSDRGFKNKAKVAFFGDRLPAFSKGLLQDGQLYYLSTISLNLIAVILIFNHNIPVVYRSFIGIPNIVLMNAMACSVFRKIKFGIFRRTTDWSSNQIIPTTGLPRALTSAIVLRGGQTRGTDGENTRNGIKVTSKTEVFDLDRMEPPITKFKQGCDSV